MPELRLGTWVKSNGSESVEIMAAAGFDFVVIDLEHAFPAVYPHIVMASGRGCAPLVRVPDHGASMIQRVLDAGAAGVLVPHVDDATQAAAAASAVRFPPHGKRGSGSTSRAARWGLLDRAEYQRFGNTDALCIAQLESRAAMANAAEILAVPGVSAGFVGAADLSLDVGLPAGHADIQEMVDGALAAAAAAGKPLGWAVGSNPAAARKAFERGFDFVVMGNDLSMLAETAHALVAEVG